MTTVTLSLFAGVGAQFLDNSGNVLTGGLIYTYSAGTTTPLATYTSNLGTTAHPNPIILDASGRVPGGEIWLATGIGYKFVLKDANDVLIGTYDNVPSSAQPPILNDASSISYEPGYTVTAGAFVVGTTYQIAFVGTTNFQAIGASNNIVGTIFVATGAGSGTGTAKLSTTVQAKLQETVSVTDFMTAAQIADVQAGTASIDCLGAFNAAIASFSTVLDNIFYSMGGTITVPPGKYYLSDTLIIARNVKLIGAGSPGGNDEGITQLVFAQNKTGILCVDYRDSPTNKQGTYLVIQDIQLSPKTAGGTTGHGVWLKTTARLINVMATGWPENGINIVASTSLVPASNANLWYLSGCTTSANGGHGLYAQGADANAGNCYAHNSVSNGGWGIWDASFLGNTYVGCHTDSNVLGAYKSDNVNARNLFINCYSESGGQPASDISYPATVLFGLLGSGINSTAPYMYTNISGIISQGQFSTGTMNLNVGLSNTNSTQQSFPDTGGSFSWTQSRVLGRVGYKWANLGAPTFFNLYDQNATPTNGYARDLSTTQGAIGVSQYYFGESNQMKLRALGSAAPVSGNYLQGDIVWNLAPTSGGYIGGVCTVAGSPGTWATFGLIS